MIKISIIIVNWNSGDYLRACLPSISDGVGDLSHEVIVVDSASTRDDIDALVSDFPTVSFIRSTKNLGFARANNLGFQHSRGELLLFLNPDTVVLGNAIVELVRSLECLATAGILGCKLLNTDGSIQLEALQPFPTILNQVLGTEYAQRRWPNCPLWRLGPLFSTSNQAVRVQAISGACLLIRRSVFEQVGLFSTDYFMYSEDVDLCYKASQSGWEAWFTPSAVIMHHGGGSSRRQSVSAWAVVAQQQAKFKFLIKFRGSGYAMLFRALIGVSAAFRVALLKILSLVGDLQKSSRYSASTSKWMAILKWSLCNEVVQ